MTERTTIRRRWYQKPWIIAGLVLLVLFLVFFGPRLIRLPGLVGRAHAEATFWQAARAEGAQALLKPDSLNEVGVHLNSASVLLADARRDWGFALRLAPLLGWLPKVGGDLAALPHLADMAGAFLDGGTALFDATKPGLEALSEGGGKALVALASAADANSDALAHAEDAFGRAESAWERVPASRLSPRLASLASTVDQALPMLAAAPEVLRLLPNLLGSDGPRRYLILAQNSDEIRPTGGFISGAGVLEVEAGEIKSLTLGDSYTVVDLTKPHPIPPAALEKHMWAEILLFRDANWWADFPTSARAAWDLYEQDTGEKVDGVIAMDTQVLQLLVEAVQPIYLKEYDDTITGDNLMERIQAYWASPSGGPDLSSQDPAWWRLRKEFMGVLTKAIMDRLMQDTVKLDLLKLAQTSLRLLNERHLLLYLPDAKDMLHQQKWDGAMVATPGDYLFLVDTNVGFNKVNAVVQESITYTVHLSDSPPTAVLQVRYVHGSDAQLDTCVHESRYGDDYKAMMDRCYWDYIRAFVPAGAELLTREGVDDGDMPEPERGLAPLDGLMILKPGETHDVTFRYRLPETVVSDGTYRLYVQKQSGTWAIPLTVVVQDTRGALASFQTDLTTDHEFVVPLQ
jgi:hypothetical protein